MKKINLQYVYNIFYSRWWVAIIVNTICLFLLAHLVNFIETKTYFKAWYFLPFLIYSVFVTIFCVFYFKKHKTTPLLFVSLLMYILTINLPTYFFTYLHIYTNYKEYYYAKHQIDKLEPISNIISSPIITEYNSSDISDIRDNNLTRIVIQKSKKENSNSYISKKYLWKNGELVLIREFYENGSIKENTIYPNGGILSCGDEHETYEYYPNGILKRYYNGEQCEEAENEENYDERGWIIK